MGFFDDLKKGLKDVSEAAKNTVEEAKAREAQRANAGTLKPDAAPQPQTQAKAPENGNVRKGINTGARLMKDGDGYKLTFGTPNPVPCEDQRYPFKIGVKFNGFIVFKDAGFDPNSIDIDNVVINTIDEGQGAIYRLSTQGYTYEKLPAAQMEIRQAIVDRLQKLGVTCSAVQIASITLDSHSRDKINEWNSKPDSQKAAELAAAGKAAPVQATPVQATPVAGSTVTCGSCGTVCCASQKFCSNCGAVLPK